MSPRQSKLILVFLILLAVLSAMFAYQPIWGAWSAKAPWRLGLDLAGGSSLTYEIDLSKVNIADRDSVVKGLRDVIEKRVNLFGVSEPKVYVETAGDTKRLVVELAGIKDVSQAIKEIGTTPFLDFRETEAVSTSSVRFIPTALSGRYVQGAQLEFDNVTHLPQIQLDFNDEGAKIFADLTQKNIGKPLGIFLDDQLIEMPTVRESIPNGKAQITGGFTIESARTLVERFNAGALPAPITLINQQTIGSDFGRDALHKAIIAGAIGTLIIILFMLLYYRFFGIFASFSLLMYIAFSLALFKLIPITLTLSGIAGFVLSIGMAVDANILVFERTKEELKRGLARPAAVEEGFRRAWTSIRDSNISTLLTSAVLYFFTSSFVQGFALTLFLGVVISMFSAITVTRTWLRIFIKDKKITNI